MLMPSGTTEMRARGMPRYCDMNAAQYSPTATNRSTLSTWSADQRERLLAVRRHEAVQEEFLALHGATDRPVECPLQRRRERDEQCVRQVDDVGERLRANPVHQLVELPAQSALLALQHGDRQASEHPGIGRDGAARKGLDHTRRVPEAIEQPRHAAKDRRVLLQVDADPTKEHAWATDIGFVGPGRRVHRQQRHIVAERHQLPGQRVVAGAATTVHSGRAGCDRENPHQDGGETPTSVAGSCEAWNARARNRKSTMLPSCG